MNCGDIFAALQCLCNLLHAIAVGIQNDDFARPAIEQALNILHRRVDENDLGALAGDTGCRLWFGNALGLDVFWRVNPISRFGISYRIDGTLGILGTLDDIARSLRWRLSRLFDDRRRLPNRRWHKQRGLRSLQTVN